MPSQRGCWLQDEACQVNVLIRVLQFLRVSWGACWLQESWQTADLDAQKKPLMCGFGVAVGCKSGHKKPLMCSAGWLLAAG